MIELFKHQERGIVWLTEHPAAGLFWTMGCGKTRTALLAARKLFDAQKIDRVLVLAPSSVLYAWKEELLKLSLEGFNHNLLAYDAKEQVFRVEAVGGNLNHNQRHINIALVSYSLLPKEHHLKAIGRYASNERTVMIADESSFLKSRGAKQSRSAYKIATCCTYRWLLTGTPVCNSPLDLWMQGKVMAAGAKGPLSSFSNFQHFECTYGDLIPVMKASGHPVTVIGRDKRGRISRQVVRKWVGNEERLKDLTKRFAPYVSRVEKKDCLDLPAKSYTVREVALTDDTWKIYVELKHECMLSLPDSEAKPEPNAAVRIMRLCQITSGHVGLSGGDICEENGERLLAESSLKDISNEKLTYLATELLSGELSNERAVIVWTRWRRERERLAELLLKQGCAIYQVYGGQSATNRALNIECFQTGADCESEVHRVLLAQPHSGGFGLNLTAASTAIFSSNDFSYSTRVQAEDRIHRIGQHHPCLYVDVVAVGPKGQRTIDAHILETLRAKKSVADLTCAEWRRALE